MTEKEGEKHDKIKQETDPINSTLTRRVENAFRDVLFFPGVLTRDTGGSQIRRAILHRVNSCTKTQ